MKNKAQPKGQILVFGPSFSGKSYLADKLKKIGIETYDLEKEGEYFSWVNNTTRKKVKPPTIKNKTWLMDNHYLMDKSKVRIFLKSKSDCIVFAGAWNILDCLDLFNKAYYLYVSPNVLNNRMKIKRLDHSLFSEDQQKFTKNLNKTRMEEVKKLNITVLDASMEPEMILNNLQ